MTNETSTEKKPPNFRLTLPKESVGCELFLGRNWITGPLLVGDTIRDIATGRRFIVKTREWQAGEAREANIFIGIEELPQP